MKRVLILATLVAIMFSCKDDDPKSYSFKDQTASGKIGGENWTTGDGWAEVDESLDITLLPSHDGGQACESFFTGDEIIFFVPAEVGVYKLFLDLEKGEGQVVTLVEEDDIPMNHVATEGAIEILSITETEVKGRLDARKDGENFINGNFTVSRCD